MHAAEAVSSTLSIVSLGDVGGGGGVTDRAAADQMERLFSRIRDSQCQMHYLIHPASYWSSSSREVCVVEGTWES